VGDKVFLQVWPMKSAIKSTKLDIHFVVPFDIVKKKSPIPYKLGFPLSLSKIHDIFHVSLLMKYVVDPYHLLVRILAFRTKKLRSWEINECLVQWDKYFESSSTWEDESTMRK